jgi:hypothetical protein
VCFDHLPIFLHNEIAKESKGKFYAKHLKEVESYIQEMWNQLPIIVPSFQK